jgi:DNA-binding response OmpR family regulator
MEKTILVVDDEERLVTLLEAYLAQAGFRVVTASNGAQALQAAALQPPDLIVLDVMMPEMDGYEFMRLYRRNNNVPIILLTAKVEADDRILGLEVGADDYLTKPFRPRELLARIRAVLRRAGAAEPSGERLSCGEVVVDRHDHAVQVAGRQIDLTPSEFDLLATLISAPGRVFTRTELLDRIQGVAYEGYERTIDVHVKNLRAKIEPEPRKPRIIETVYGIGYRFARE